jgi:hypothetical protein
MKLPDGSVELFNSSLKPGDNLPLSIALFQVFAAKGFQVGPMFFTLADGLTCEAKVMLGELGGESQVLAPFGHDKLVELIADYMQSQGDRRVPSIIPLGGRFIVLPPEPFLPKQQSSQA